MTTCPFCLKDRLANQLQDGTPCRTDIYEDEHCFAILAPEQYTSGHTLLILKGHKIDMTDDLSPVDLPAFISAIHKVSKRLKDSAENDRGERPQRIYVSILCDGVQHLHAHLIPRYPFNETDKRVYRKLFFQRDGHEAVIKALQKGDLGGFWYLADREVNHKWSEFKLKSNVEQARILEERANGLRIQSSHKT